MTASGEPADLVLGSGVIGLPDGGRPRPTAVAVSDGRITFVGSDTDVAPLIGRRTDVIDLRGRLVLPGFQDAHAHPSQGGLHRLECDLSELSGRAAYLDAIEHYARAHPDETWIVGAGWAPADFPDGIAAAADLDRIVPDRPVYLVNADHHGAWVNSAALRAAGIDAATTDPPGGHIERDASGHPVGTLQEGAMDLVSRVAPAPGIDRLADGIREAQRFLLPYGITAWQDAWVEPDVQAAYESAATAGDLVSHVVLALWWDRSRGIEQVEELQERRRRAARAGLDAGTVKIMVDGVVENRTAALTDPYDRHSGRGTLFLEPADLDRAVAALDAAGFNVHLHAIGDRAVSASLDAIGVLPTATRRDRRHHIAHVQVVRPADVPRFAGVGVTAAIQPLWACRDDAQTRLTEPVLGRERTGWQYPFRSLLASGARLAIGSDWPVTTPDPFAQLHVAVHRTPPDDPASPPLVPAEALTMAEAVTAFTAGSAFVARRDDAGRIEPGAIADLVIVDRDISRPDVPIAGARVDSTLIAGRVVWDRETDLGPGSRAG